jgi:hypothetical protein
MSFFCGVEAGGRSGGVVLGEVEGVNLNGLPVWTLSTNSNCERLDAGLVLGADVRLSAGSGVNVGFLENRPKLSLG